MAAPRSGDLTGRLLGNRYELRALLGEGGMGVVYHAQDTMLRRDVAVKVFRDGATEIARTASETQLLAGLNHPALVTLYDAHVGAEEPRYLVMEYIEGPTLEERLYRGPLSERTTSRLARDLAEALHVVHQAGIVHRDVKPANVLLRAAGVPGEEFHAKLADFGIAYLIDTTRLTTPGTIIGSAAYLSPEQVTGADPLPASDIYSLGLVLLEALTGQRAFAQDGVREAVLARLTQDPVIPSSVGHDWGTLLTAMTARDPAHRPTAMDITVGVPRPNSLPSIASAASATVALPDVAAGDEQQNTIELTTTRTAVLQPDSKIEPEPEPELEPDSKIERQPELEPDPQLEMGRTRRRPRRLRWLSPTVLAAVIAIIIVGAVSFWGGGEKPGPPPELPALEEPLASHLQQLLDSVSP